MKSKKEIENSLLTIPDEDDENIISPYESGHYSGYRNALEWVLDDEEGRVKEMILFSFEMDLNVDIHIDVTHYEPEEEQRNDCPASGPVVEFNAYFIIKRSIYNEEAGEIQEKISKVEIPDDMYDSVAESVIEQAIENY